MRSALLLLLLFVVVPFGDSQSPSPTPPSPAPPPAPSFEDQLAPFFEAMADSPFNTPLNFEKETWCFDYFERKVPVREKKCVYAHVFGQTTASHSYDQTTRAFFEKFLPAGSAVRKAAFEALDECDRTESTHLAFTIYKQEFPFVLLECCKPPGCYEQLFSAFDALNMPTCLRGGWDETAGMWIQHSDRQFNRSRTCSARYQLSGAGTQVTKEVVVYEPCGAAQKTNSCAAYLQKAEDGSIDRYMCCVSKMTNTSVDSNAALQITGLIDAYLGSGRSSQLAESCAGLGDVEAGQCFLHFNFTTGLFDSKFLKELPAERVEISTGFNASCFLFYGTPNDMVPSLYCNCSTANKPCDLQFYEAGVDFERHIENFTNHIECEEKRESAEDRDENPVFSPVVGCAIDYRLLNGEVHTIKRKATLEDFRQVDWIEKYNDWCATDNKDQPSYVFCVCRPSFPGPQNDTCNRARYFWRPLAVLHEVSALPIDHNAEILSKITLDYNVCHSSHNWTITDFAKKKLVNFGSHVLCFFVFDVLNQDYQTGERGAFVRQDPNEDITIFPKLLCRKLVTDHRRSLLLTGCKCGLMDDGEKPQMACCCVPEGLKPMYKRAHSSSALIFKPYL